MPEGGRPRESSGGFLIGHDFDFGAEFYIADEFDDSSPAYA